jgi:hypothetical protein
MSKLFNYLVRFTDSVYESRTHSPEANKVEERTMDTTSEPGSTLHRRLIHNSDHC